MLWRLFIILKEAGSLIIFYYSLPRDENRDKKIGERLRLSCERLGATYIKLGQMLSMRPDFIPSAYCIELENLLDSAPTISSEQIKKAIEQELGQSIDKLFKDFSDKPLAAASLSQVHRATLFSGEKVVIKVLRPRVRQLIYQDIRCLRLTTRFFGNIIFDGKDNFLDLINTLEGWLERETNYEEEFDNMLIMNAELKDIEKVIIPKAYKHLSTKDILVMEYVDGLSVLEIIRLKRRGALPDFPFSLQELMESLIEEMGINNLTRAHFHADLHPANILIKPNGVIYLLDFGLIQYFDKRVRKNVALFMLGIALSSPELIISASKKLATFSPKYNESKVFSSLSEACDAYKDAPASQMSNGQLLIKIFSIGLTNGITFPWNLILYTRSAMHLDGMVLNLCPNFVFSNYSRQKFLKIYGEIAIKEIISLPAFIEKTSDIIEMLQKF